MNLSKQQKSIQGKWLNELFTHINVHHINEYLQNGSVRIRTDVITWHDFWSGIISTPPFVLYDTQLDSYVREFYTAWTEIVEFGSKYYSLDEQDCRYYKFFGYKSDEFDTLQDEQAFDEIVDKICGLRPKFDKMIDYVKRNYLLDLDALSSIAMNTVSNKSSIKMFSTEIRTSPGDPYLKVFLRRQDDVETCKSLIEQMEVVRKVNITHSNSKDHPGDTLTVYKKSVVDIDELEKAVNDTLQQHFDGVKVIPKKIVADAIFDKIESEIIANLKKAKAMVDLCVAWFTNEKLLDGLRDCKARGCKVRIIVYKDGVNKKHGVDLSEFDWCEARGKRGGIMHKKYCVIDNNIVIEGSYNWTNNAEQRNDESINTTEGNTELASKYTVDFNSIWDANINLSIKP